MEELLWGRYVFVIEYFKKSVVHRIVSVGSAYDRNKVRFSIQIEYFPAHRTVVELSCVRHVAL